MGTAQVYFIHDPMEVVHVAVMDQAALIVIDPAEAELISIFFQTTVHNGPPLSFPVDLFFVLPTPTKYLNLSLVDRIMWKPSQTMTFQAHLIMLH